MRRIGAIIIAVACINAPITCSAQPGAAASAAGAIEYLLNNIDTDGDGVATFSDRFVVDWWLEEGGTLQVLLPNCQFSPTTGVICAHEFFDSPEAQLGGGAQAVAQAAAQSQGQSQTLGATTNLCSTVPTIPSLPPNPTPIQVRGTSASELNDTVATSGFPMAPHIYIEVTGNPPGGSYSEVHINPNQYQNGLTIYAVPAVGSPGEIVVEGFRIWSPNTPIGDVTIGQLVEDTATGVITRHGFRVSGGTAVYDFPTCTAPRDASGGGIRAVGLTTGGLHILGNDVTGNEADRHGGGIAIFNSLDVLVAHNNVWDNKAGKRAQDLCNPSPPFPGNPPGPGLATELLGAGIYVESNTAPSGLGIPSISIVANTIFGNTFDPPFTQPPEHPEEGIAKKGGGVAIVGIGGNLGDAPWFELCGNTIGGVMPAEANRASEGCGVYLGNRQTTGTARFDVYENEILGNLPWETTDPFPNPYLGGGLNFTDVNGQGQSNPNLIANEIHGNSCVPGSTFSQGQAIAPFMQNQVGGGVFLYDRFQNNSSLLVEANAVWNNTAFDRGAGLYIDANGGAVTAGLYHNTIRENSPTVVTGPVFGVGLSIAPNCAFVGANNVLWGNQAGLSGASGSQIDYYWDDSVINGNSVALENSTMPNLSASQGQPLQGVGSDDIDPSFDPVVENNILADSGCIDRSSAYTNQLQLVQFDFEGEDRAFDYVGYQNDGVGVSNDRGVDEHTSKFIRGDANNDGGVSLPDPVRILNELFGMPPLAPINCVESRDADSNGSVQITDAIFLLNYLFNSTAAPGPPFPNCGKLPLGQARCDFIANSICN